MQGRSAFLDAAGGVLQLIQNPRHLTHGVAGHSSRCVLVEISHGTDTCPPIFCTTVQNLGYVFATQSAFSTTVEPSARPSAANAIPSLWSPWACRLAPPTARPP